jgi:hypothetical protein
MNGINNITLPEHFRRLISLCLAVSICLAFHTVIRAQRTPPVAAAVYEAELLVSDGKKIKAEPVELSLESDELKIRGSKNSSAVSRSIAFSSIKSADYTYSDRPRYTAGVLATLALGGLGGLPVFFTKTKKNWLTVEAEKDYLILQLKGDNYRMLLLEMRRKGIKISDSGDRDEKRNSEKTGQN